jgi:hypothetical protein
MDDLAKYFRSLRYEMYVERVETVEWPSVERTELVDWVSIDEPLFSYLTIEPCLRAVPQSLEECLAQGPWVEEAARGGFILRRRRILRVCLWGCPPFKGLAPPQIRAVLRYRKNQRPQTRCYPCQNRDALFDDLVEAVHAYEVRRCDLQPARRAKSRKLQRAREYAEELRRQKKPFANPDIGLSPAAFIQLVDEVEKVRSKIPPDELRRQVWALKQRLVVDMAKALDAHGPPKFPKVARHAVLADILTALGVTNQQDKAFTAAGIKGILTRGTTGASPEV